MQVLNDWVLGASGDGNCGGGFAGVSDVLVLGPLWPLI